MVSIGTKRTSLTAVWAAVVAALLAAPAPAPVLAGQPVPPARPEPAAGIAPHAASDLRVAPRMLRLAARQGEQIERTVTLTNTGASGLEWRAADGRAGTRPASAGTVLRSWPAGGIAVGWGIGVESGNVWISDIDLLRNDSFTVDGVKRDEGWPTSWASDFPGPADMAYVPQRALMCQLKVGGENGVHCWQPRTGEVVVDIVGDLPWTATPHRGLAYRPDDDTFYVGGDQGVIYHVKGVSYADPGGVLGQCEPPERAIAGLGWSVGFGLLWAITSSSTPLIYALDPDTCRAVTTITPPDQSQFRGAGLDVDPAGNLWIMSAGWGNGNNPGAAYQVGSGVPLFSDAPWLSVTPASGTLAAGARQRLTVRVNAAGLARGTHTAALYLLTGDPRQPSITIPVTLTVR